MKLQLLVDSPSFRASLAADLPQARRSLLLQTLTFEGDAVGRDVASLIQASPAADRRVIVDYFTWHVLSDRFRWRPRNLVSPSVWREAFETRRLFGRLRRDGVGVRYVNGAGFLFWHFPARNHKKLVALDGRVAYIGGINYSDHNFAWHDLMLRIEDERVAAFLEEDFRATWGGENRGGALRLPGFELHSLDGSNNEAVFDEVFDLLAGAREEIVVECPYITDPVTRELERAARRGVRVTVLMPEHHNWPLVREGLAHAAMRSPIDLRLFPARMTHMKAMLIDRRCVVLGSANFDIWSYRSQMEYLAVVSEPGLVEDFRRRVAEPDALASRPCPGPRSLDERRAVETRLAGLGYAACLGAYRTRAKAPRFWGS